MRKRKEKKKELDINKEKNNKIIIEAKNKIKEEKEKIRLERLAIKRRKRENFKKSKFGKSKLGRLISKIFFIFSDKDRYSFQELFATTIISLVLGFFACFSLFTILTRGKNVFKLSKELNKFYDVYEVLTDNYSGDIDKEKLVNEAINGMVSSVGDTYTNYNDVSATESFNQMVSGTYEGIGCTIQKDENGIKIIDIYDNSPAKKAGLKENDLIIKVDAINAKETDTEKLSTYIKEEAKGKINITVLRDKEEKTFTLERGKVEIPSVVSKTFKKDDKLVGYLGITIFSSVTSKQFEKELLSLEEKRIDSLIIDVRGNNGGYLSSVTDIASLLLPKGSVIYQIQKNNKKEVTKDKTSKKREYPIAVLVNNGSASASEILAAAIKESYKGFVVGTKTYGKGTVQQVKQLSDGSMIKYTVENWLTPKGNWINEVGIEPTDTIELDEKYFEKPSDESDNQLQKAIELVTK